MVMDGMWTVHCMTSNQNTIGTQIVWNMEISLLPIINDRHMVSDIWTPTSWEAPLASTILIKPLFHILTPTDPHPPQPNPYPKRFKDKLFRFSTILDRGNVNFKITDPSGLSNNLDGVIGSFIPMRSYQILKHVGDLGLLERFWFSAVIEFILTTRTLTTSHVWQR